MKAAVLEAPGQLTVRRDVPEPDPGPYEARCALLFGGVCAGTDSHLVAGDPPFGCWVQHPAILGHESVGRVVEVGEKVRHLKSGDVVTRVGTPAVGEFGSTWGGFAEQGIATDWQALQEDGADEARWRSKRVQRVLPADVEPAAATMFITWRETWSYLERAGVAAGASVLVIGSGGNGLAFLSHAKALGAGRRVMLGSPNRRERAERAGATAFIDYRQDDAAKQAEAACEVGYDLVIDSVGKAGLAELGLSLLRDGGTIGIYGMDDVAATQINPRRARGDFRFHGPRYDEAAAHEAVLTAYQSGELDPSIWLELDEPYPLDDINEALAAVHRRERVKPLIRLSEA